MGAGRRLSVHPAEPEEDEDGIKRASPLNLFVIIMTPAPLSPTTLRRSRSGHRPGHLTPCGGAVSVTPPQGKLLRPPTPGRGGGAGPTPAHAGRAPPPAGTERLARAGERLRQSRAALAEAEASGAATLRELRAQREALERARGGLGDAGADLAASDRLLARMAKPVKTFFSDLLGVTRPPPSDE